MVQSSIDRRSFIKGASVSAAAAVTLGAVLAPAAVHADAAETFPCDDAGHGIPAEHYAKLHHFMIEYKDMNEAVHFWQDVMGFTLIARFLYPEELQEPSDDLLQYEVACFDSGTGACVECMKHLSPVQVELPYNQHGASDSATGMKEIAFLLDDAQWLYDRVVEEGYEIIVDLHAAGFEFNDREGNSIQICTYADPANKEVFWASFDGIVGDTRTPEQIAYVEALY